MSGGPATPAARQKIWLKVRSRNLPCLYPSFGQPSAEVDDQADLNLTRLPCIAIAAHPRCVRIQIPPQGAVPLA